LRIFDIEVLLIFLIDFHFVIFLEELSTGNVSIFGYFRFGVFFLLLFVPEVRHGIKQPIVSDHADKTWNVAPLTP